MIQLRDSTWRTGPCVTVKLALMVIFTLLSHSPAQTRRSERRAHVHTHSISGDAASQLVQPECRQPKAADGNRGPFSTPGMNREEVCRQADADHVTTDHVTTDRVTRLPLYHQCNSLLTALSLLSNPKEA